MVSIIKNQLLKHLSRFTKNLSADKINLSTFKGEGELSNLELDEDVLTELLELPTWLRLTKAWCNRVTFGIPWTKLKSVPICLNLDEIHITVETCEELRMFKVPTTATYNPGKYSFIQKVIDGITVCVNNVYIVFNSPAFVATIQITRIRVESKSPKFTKSELRMTRLKNQEKGQLLIFKELEWQTLRIEAKSTKDENLTPLRLLTNQARCRIVIKKRLSDCFILGSRLAIILDDLLWVLTDSQLRAAVHFLDSLSDLVEKATRLTRRVKAARKLEELPEYRAQMAQEIHETSEKSKIFSAYDVVETSYHFISNQIVLHLCDDPGSGRSSNPHLKDGGALQICLKKFQIDYYPYHLAKGNRKHWPRYNVSSAPHSMWQDQALSSFKAKLMDLLDNSRSQHTPLSRADKIPQNTPKSPESDSRRNNQRDHEASLKLQLSKLMTTCVILRIEDFTVYRVATSNNRGGLKEFVFGDRSSMSLPQDSNIVHAEFIYYYYPADCSFPLPPPKFYVQVNPITVSVDIDSCLWLNSFILNLFQSLENSKNEVQVSNYSYVDVKIEAILPKINFESDVDLPGQRDRPRWLSLQVTRATVTNTRSLEQSSRADLARCVDSFHLGSLFFGSGFPSRPGDFYLLTQKFFDHISAEDNVRNAPAKLSREMLWLEAKDVWCVSLDPVWADFGGARAPGVGKSVAFLDAVPVTVWLHTSMDPNSTLRTPTDVQGDAAPNADIHAIVHVSNLVSVQMNHYQYLFLMRLADSMAMMTTYLSLDAERILKVDSNNSMVMGVFLPQVEVTFVMPSNCPGKESSGGDGESFLPDSSSIAGDAIVGSTQSVWHNTSLSTSQVEAAKKTLANGSSTQLDAMICYPVEFEEQRTEVKYRVQEFSGGQQQQQQQQLVNLPANLNVGLTSMRKGFTSLMSSIDGALKSSGAGADDLSDAASTRSDASSDSEQFVHVSLGADDAPAADLMFVVRDFRLDDGAGVEEAAEVVEEGGSPATSGSGRSGSAASGRRKDLVSISTFKMKTVEILHQSVGYSSSLKIQVGDIACDDCSSIPWDEFQSKFNTRSRAWNASPGDASATSKVRLRLDHGLAGLSSDSLMRLDLTDRRQFAGAFRDVLAVRVDGLALELNMGTLMNLTDLIEDEMMPIFFPVKVELENVKIHLNEDRPPANVTSPGPVPIDLSIPRMNISRDEHGVIHILPDVGNSENDEDAAPANAQLARENDELRRRLAAFERVCEENRSLRQAKEEAEALRGWLRRAQDDAAQLLGEKERLLDEVRRLGRLGGGR